MSQWTYLGLNYINRCGARGVNLNLYLAPPQNPPQHPPPPPHVAHARAVSPPPHSDADFCFVFEIRKYYLARGWLAESSVPRLSIPTRWQLGVLPYVTVLTHSSTIAHLTSCMCFVSASCQTIAAFNQLDRDNLGWIRGISPLTRLSDSSEIYSVGIDHRQPTDKRDYRR